MSDAIADWISRYRRAWESNEPDDIRALFTTDATYRTEPYAGPWRGIDRIVEGWLEIQDEPGETTFEWNVLAETDGLAVVEGTTVYSGSSTYSNLWVIRLDGDRATAYTEWWMTHPETPSGPGLRPSDSADVDEHRDWFERFYAAGEHGGPPVPWDRGGPHQLLEQWVRSGDVAGAGRSALVADAVSARTRSISSRSGSTRSPSTSLRGRSRPYDAGSPTPRWPITSRTCSIPRASGGIVSTSCSRA